MTLNFDTICRTCMSQSQALMCIFGAENSEQNDDIVSMLSSITNIQAFKNDGLPENVCIACLSEINRAFSFKNRSERSENTLKQYLNQLTTKSEPSSSDYTVITNPNTITPSSDDEHFEIIELEGEQDGDGDIEHDVTEHNIHEVTDMYKDETENIVEDSNNKPLNDSTLGKPKIFVLEQMPAMEHLSNQISVLYECHICYDSFESISSSEQHMETSHGFVKESHFEDSSTNRMRCSICSLNFDNSDYLRKHVQEQHPDDNGMEEQEFRYESENVHITDVIEVDEIEEKIQDDSQNKDNVQEVITSEVTTTEQIASVIVVRTNESIGQELKFNCDKCGGKFAKERSLNRHTKLNKCTIKSFECGLCKKVFVRKKNLDLHMQTHSESNDYTCKVCSEMFTQADQLAMHIQSQHEPNRKHLCPYCWKGFNVSSSLKDHIRIHNGEKPFLCSICGKRFSQSTNLNQHVMRHNKMKPFSCSICSYSFVSKGELDAHSRKHSGLHPFVCEVCGASFTTSSSLVKHNRIHSGERPYACEYCPMRFAALGTLKNHIRTHNGARPFACAICNRTFSQRSDCLSHQDTHSADKSFFCKQCYKSFHKKSGLRNHMKIHRNDCAEESRISSDVVTMDNGDEINMKLTYVTEIYATNDD